MGIKIKHCTQLKFKSLNEEDVKSAATSVDGTRLVSGSTDEKSRRAEYGKRRNTLGSFQNCSRTKDPCGQYRCPNLWMALLLHLSLCHRVCDKTIKVWKMESCRQVSQVADNP